MSTTVPCLDPMAPVFIGLGQRVKVDRPSRQVLDGGCCLGDGFKERHRFGSSVTTLTL